MNPALDWTVSHGRVVALSYALFDAPGKLFESMGENENIINAVIKFSTNDRVSVLLRIWSFDSTFISFLGNFVIETIFRCYGSVLFRKKMKPFYWLTVAVTSILTNRTASFHFEI